MPPPPMPYSATTYPYQVPPNCFNYNGSYGPTPLFPPQNLPAFHSPYPISHAPAYGSSQMPISSRPPPPPSLVAQPAFPAEGAHQQQQQQPPPQPPQQQQQQPPQPPSVDLQVSTVEQYDEVMVRAAAPRLSAEAAPFVPTGIPGGNANVARSYARPASSAALHNYRRESGSEAHLPVAPVSTSLSNTRLPPLASTQSQNRPRPRNKPSASSNADSSSGRASSSTISFAEGVGYNSLEDLRRALQLEGGLSFKKNAAMKQVALVELITEVAFASKRSAADLMMDNDLLVKVLHVRGSVTPEVAASACFGGGQLTKGSVSGMVILGLGPSAAEPLAASVSASPDLESLQQAQFEYLSPDDTGAYQLPVSYPNKSPPAGLDLSLDLDLDDNLDHRIRLDVRFRILILNLPILNLRNNLQDTGYGLALAAPRPGLVSLVFPHPTPHPPSHDSPEAVEHADVTEKGLHELDVVRRLKAEVVPSLAPAEATSSDAAPAQATSLTKAASQLTPTSSLDIPLQPRYTLSRPYAATPPGPHSLSGYTLRGPGKFAVPPLVFTTRDKRESVLVVHVGGGLCGHEGVVHGGLLATVMDEALGRTALLNLPTNIGVTATLTMKYKKPTFANQYLVIRTELTEQKGRKAWVKGRIESTDGETLVEAEALFVEPRMAKFLSNSSVREALK
ncbi:hypothetical protein JCM10295v2_006238 [Rhodotorula toruloides]